MIEDASCGAFVTQVVVYNAILFAQWKILVASGGKQINSVLVEFSLVQLLTLSLDGGTETSSLD
jgi:hypothetical protein